MAHLFSEVGRSDLSVRCFFLVCCLDRDVSHFLSYLALHELANGDLGFFGQREEPHPEPIYPVVRFHLPSFIVLFSAVLL